MYKKCSNCKKEFYIVPSASLRRHNCSLSCSYITRKTFYKSASWDEKVLHLKERFEKLVIKKDEGCWGWKGSITNGYAKIAFENLPLSGHRASWIIFKGVLPKKLFVCHKCNNALCTNPEHLYLGTHKQNMKDRKNCRRDPVGEKNGMSKLKEKEVLEMKKMFKKKISGAEIARFFNISPGIVSEIKNGHYWAYLNKNRSARELAAKEAMMPEGE
jgi:hypothetical protein